MYTNMNGESDAASRAVSGRDQCDLERDGDGGWVDDKCSIRQTLFGAWRRWRALDGGGGVQQ